MPMVAWGAPTLSDSDKLEFVDGSGERVAQLSLQLAYSNDFSVDFGELTEVDTGSNVDVSGGKLNVQGSNLWDANGVYMTTPVAASTPGKIAIKVTARGQAYYCVFGLAAAAAITYNDSALKHRFSLYNSLQLQQAGSMSYGNYAINVDTEYLCEWEWNADGVMSAYITGGVFGTRTHFGSVRLGSLTNVGFQISAHTAFGDQWEFDDYARYSGYDTGGEYMTFVADAGAGQVFSGLDWTNVAAPTGISTTNLKYQYSFDDGTPSYNGSWLTLAQLQAVGSVAGNYRYIRLRVQLNSDGNTQNYGAEVNAGDLVAGVFAQPSAAIILTGNTVNDVAGSFDEAARNTDPGVGNVVKDVGYLIQNVAKVGTFDEAARNTDPGVENVSDGVTYKIQNVDLEGELVSGGSAPTAPDISVARASDTSATVTFSESQAGVTNEVRYATIADAGDTWMDGGSRSGDGAVTLSGLTSGQMYLIIGYSVDGTNYSEPSNVVIYTSGPATGAVGAYASFLSDLYNDVRNSAALADEVSTGTPSNHCKLGLHLWTGSGENTLIAAGPIIYVEPMAYTRRPRSPDRDRGDFSAVLHIFYPGDQSAADSLLNAINFNDALTKEVMAGGNNTGTHWSTYGAGISASVEGPTKVDGARDRLYSRIAISAGYSEAY